MGWDAAALQFMLAWHGFPSATVDGAFGSHSVRALEKFERWAGLPADGVAGPAVHRRAPAAAADAARSRCAPPLPTAYTDGFGPRGNRFHTGLDFPAAHGHAGRGRRAGPGQSGPARWPAAGGTS